LLKNAYDLGRILGSIDCSVSLLLETVFVVVVV
jgi:hypothetical protein